MPNLEYREDIKEALEVFHVLARTRRPHGSLRDLRDFHVDGEEAICACTPICTPVERVLDDDVPQILPEVQDPKGVVQQYLQLRRSVILPENEVDVYLATHGRRYVEVVSLRR